MKAKQITVVAIVVAVAGYLYWQPVKGLIKTNSERGAPAATQASRPAVANVTVDQVSTPAKAAIGAALTARINDLEGQLKNASGDAGKLSLQKQLAKQWDDDNQPAPSAFYYLAVARKENAFDDWINAGNHFNEAYNPHRIPRCNQPLLKMLLMHLKTR